ncbi:MAG: hypothetical protein V8R85_02940 [Frisingicoccus sp.]
MKSRVVLLKCNEYDKEKIYEELSWGIGQIGGVGQLCPVGGKDSFEAESPSEGGGGQRHRHPSIGCIRRG